MDPIIHTRELTKDYPVERQPVRALDRVSLTVDVGEMVAVMGPSGSGKSTLLHLLGCLDRPSAGDYWFRSGDVGELSDEALTRLRRRYIGFVFQSFNLLPRSSALENVELPLTYAGFARRPRRAKARAALERVGLQQRMDHAASKLSGGEQQRVAIARGLVNDPALILADEPTGALDSGTGRSILELLKSLNATGITVLIVTHDPFVASYAPRLVQMLDGRVGSDRPNPSPAAVMPVERGGRPGA